MKVTGTFILYAIETDSTMLPDLSAIAPEHNAPTKNTIKGIKQFLNYATPQEEATINFLSVV